MAGKKEYSDENNVDQIIPVNWAILLGVPVWMPEYKHKKPISSLEPKWGGAIIYKIIKSKQHNNPMAINSINFEVVIYWVTYWKKFFFIFYINWIVIIRHKY